MNIILTNTEKVKLKRMHKQIKDQKNCDRIKAVLLLSDGYTIKKVSKILLVDEDTISSWKNKFNSRILFSDWLEDKYVTYKGKMNQDQKKIIEKYIKENVICDSKQVITFIEKRFGITFSTAGIVSFLHNLGFEYKKTELIPSKYDALKQKEFKDMYENLENDIKDDEVIIFGDGVHPQHNTVCTKAWIKKGENKQIKSNSGRSRINIQGIYNPVNQDIIIHEDVTLNAQNTIEFMKKIEKFYSEKRKIHLILDNARYYKNKEVERYLENSTIEIIFLPPYSPNLNLIERLWKFMRKKVINNKYYEKFSIFKKVIMEFFENCSEYKEELATFIGCKLHLLEK